MAKQDGHNWLDALIVM